MPQVSTLLIFRIAGIPFGVEAESIASIVMPPGHLTHPPGSSNSMPGIFHHAGHVHVVIDLHARMGIERNGKHVGRLLLYQEGSRHYAFLVDEVVGLFETSQGKWANLPPYLPRKLFWSGFLLRKEIVLCTELSSLRTMHDASPLQHHLNQSALTSTAGDDSPVTANTASIRQTPTTPPPQLAATTVDKTVHPPSPQPPPMPPRQQDAHHRAIPAVPRVEVPSAKHHTSSPGPKPARPLHTPASPTQVTRFEHEQPGHMSAAPSIQIPERPAADTSAHPPLVLWLLPLLLMLAAAWWLWWPDSTPAPSLRYSYTSPGTPSAPSPDRQTAPIVTESIAITTPKSIPDSVAEPVTEQSAEQPLRIERNGDGELHLIIERRALRAERPQIETAESISSGLTLTVTETEMPMDKHETAVANAEEDASSPITATEAAALQQTETPTTTLSTEQTPVAEPQDPIPSPTPPSAPESSAWFDPTSVQVEPCECLHIVVPGDTLWSIARRYTGNAYNYPELARHSGIHDPHWIYPGDRIRITIR